MRSDHRNLTLAPLALAAAILAGCGTTVRPGQAGIRYFGWGGGLDREVKNEGFYFEWPWDDVVVYDITWSSRTEQVDVLTAEGLHVPTQITVTYRPRRSALYQLATEIGTSYYQDVIQPPFRTLARAEFAKYRHNEIPGKSAAIEQAMTSKLQQAIRGKPIEIDRVSIGHIQFDPRITTAISDKRATAERVEQKASELSIAAQDAEIARVSAAGRRDAMRIQAEGEAAAITLRGEAQARAQQEIAKTLTPDYLRFKAFDGDATKYYFVPTGRDGLPVIVNTEPGRSPLR